VKDLKFERSQILNFLSHASGLGEKKGCILIQFPGKINIDHYADVENILLTLQENADGWRLALELRNKDWYIPETMELADHFNSSIVIHDKSRGRNDSSNESTDFIYMRFHGPEGNYRGSYSDEHLRKKAGEIRAHLQKGKIVYAYFNNTMGPALENLNTLRNFITG